MRWRAGYFIILILNGLMLPAPQSRTLVVALAAGVAALLLAWHWIFLPLAAVPGAILAGVNARRLLQMIPRIGSFLEGLNDRQEIWVARLVADPSSSVVRTGILHLHADLGPVVEEVHGSRSQPDAGNAAELWHHRVAVAGGRDGVFL